MTDQPRDPGAPGPDHEPTDPYRGEPRHDDPAAGSARRPADDAGHGSQPPQAPAYDSQPAGPGHDRTGGAQAGHPGQVPPGGGADAYGQGYGQPAPKGSNGLAIGALVCGILAIPGACCGGWGGVVLGVVAIVLAVLARKKIAQGAGGKGLATAGMITGIIGLVLGALLLVVGMAMKDKIAPCEKLKSDPVAQQKCVLDKLGLGDAAKNN